MLGVLQKISDIEKDEWNDLVGAAYPFMRWEFLNALEVSGAVSESTGWQISHLYIRDEETLIAVMPLYLKYHSQGEYVFDYAWANAFHRYGIEYYPK